MKEQELKRQAMLETIQDLNVKLREKLEEAQGKYAEMHTSEDKPYTNRERIAISAERKGVSDMYYIFMVYAHDTLGFQEEQIWEKTGYDKD